MVRVSLLAHRNKTPRTEWLKQQKYFVAYTCRVLGSVYSLMDTGCFHTLAIADNAAVNVGVRTPLQDNDFLSYGYISRSEVAGS